tara:strand:- start:442 stop:786 length:345 start_codon:yes stop_codon:yes gene_type:complete
MAITKRTTNDKIEIVNSWSIQVRTATIIEEDDVELSRSFHRHVLTPCTSTFKTKEVNGDEVADLDSDGKKQWTHTDTDISKEASEVQAICNAVWTDTVKANYKSFVESQGGLDE